MARTVQGGPALPVHMTGNDGTAAPVSGTVTANQGTAGASAWPVAQTGALPAGDNNVGNVDVLTLPALPAGTNNIGDVDVLTLPALPAGTNNIGDVDVLTLPALPAGANNIGSVLLATAASVVGLLGFLNAALTNTAVSVKASQARFYGFSLYNPAAAVTYMQIFNTVAGSVTLGTTPPILAIGVPPAQAVQLHLTIPVEFSTALVVAATTTATGSSAPATALVANVYYK